MSKDNKRGFVSAKEGVAAAGYEKGSVRYYDKQGNVLIRYEGTKAWRCNNPGSIMYVKKGFAMRHGAIGHAMGMAVFPSEFSGRVALIARLKTEEFGAYSLDKFAEVWEPKNIIEYKRMLFSISKIPLEKKIRDLSPAEFSRFRETIEQIEGWKEGWEEFYEKKYISGVKKQNNTIMEYLIRDAGELKWVSKNEAIALAEKGGLHAVIVHSKHGIYLRPEYHAKRFNDMLC